MISYCNELMNSPQEIDVYLPSVTEINKELASLINDRVIYHLSQILRHLADDHQMNFEMLNEQYLRPIKEVEEEMSKAL